MLKMCDVFSGSQRSFATQKGTDITMIKATEGTSYVNPYCEHDYQAAKNAGKELGVYHYAAGGNPEKEAQTFRNNIKGYLYEAACGVDWEKRDNASWGDPTWVRRFVNEFHRLTGVWCLIYVQESAINQVANCAKNCGLWVAKYPSMDWKSWTVPNMKVNTAPWPTYTAWQFTGDNMDRSIVNVTRDGWRKLAKGDGKATTSNKPAKASTAKSEWKKKSGTFVLGQALKLHKSPHIDSPAIAELPKGSEVKFDATLQGPLRLWLRQPRAKGYGYIVAKDKYGKMLGKIK